MTDVVVELPVRTGEEDELFGAFLSRFMDSRMAEAERLAGTCDAPYLMVRSSPTIDGDLKTVIFQDHRPARAFFAGWRRLKRRANLAQA